jgi:DNA (cytosine-5)-methyltransferase 1
VRWTVLGADDVGAPHRRKRLWILADATSDNGRASGPREVEGRATGLPEHGGEWSMAYASQHGRCEGRPESAGEQGRRDAPECGAWWSLDPADLPDTERSDGHGRGCNLQMGWSRESSTGEQASDTAGSEWGTQSRLGRVAHGVAHRVQRLRAIGNGQVPAVAAAAWLLLGGPR